MNLPELLKIAEAATPGEWEAINDTVEDENCQMIAHVMTSKYSATYKADGSIEHIGDAVDAEYIAAFSPSVAIALIKRLQEAEKYAARWRFIRPGWSNPDEVEANCDKEIAAMNGGKE